MTVGYSVLFCDRARSEDRMAPSNEPTGEIAPDGFSPAWLRERCDSINAGDSGFASYIVDLTGNCPHACEEACVMVVRPPSSTTADACLREIEAVQFDTFTSARGRVLNAHTRHLAFLGEEARSPDASTGEHTVLAWAQIPATDRARQELVGLLGHLPYVRSGCVLKYPDIHKCGIGWHGAFTLEPPCILCKTAYIRLCRSQVTARGARPSSTAWATPPPPDRSASSGTSRERR